MDGVGGDVARKRRPIMHLHCERCAEDVTATLPADRFAWRAAIVLLWVSFFALIPFAAVMLPLNVILIPLLTVPMMLGAGYAADRANPPPRCPRCECDLSHAPRATALGGAILSAAE